MPPVANRNRILFGVRPTHHITVQVMDCGWIRLREWDFDDLEAPVWRLYHNDARGAHVLLNGQRTDLLPSRCYLIPPMTPFSTRLDRPVLHFCLHFMTTPSRLHLAPGIYECPFDSSFRRLLAELRLQFEAGNGAALRTSLLAQSLAHEALQLVPAAQLVYEQRDQRMARVLRAMEAHLAAPLSNAELARRAGMGLNAFIRLYRETMGCTPQHDYGRLRMDRAVFLLLSSDLGVKEISEETGFCDRYHFTHAFTRRQGVGPAQFRRQHGGRLAPAATAPNG
jgi:AraC-like DNA-binding protein